MWDIISENKIRAAMDEGQFENLEGQGKPIDWSRYETNDLAHLLLRNNGFALPWIEEKNEIEAALQKARAALVRAWNDRQAGLRAGFPAAEGNWRSALAAFQKTVAFLNRRIFNYNLRVPATRFQRMYIDADREVAALENPVE